MSEMNYFSYWRPSLIDLSHTHQVRRYSCTSRSVLPDPENMDITVGIMLLSCIQAEILAYSVCTVMHFMATIFD